MRYPKKCYIALRLYELKRGVKLKGEARRNFLRNVYRMIKLGEEMKREKK